MLVRIIDTHALAMRYVTDIEMLVPKLLPYAAVYTNWFLFLGILLSVYII